MDIGHGAMIAGGVLLAAWNTWQHLGRTAAARSWADSVQGSLKQRSVLVVRPLVAAVLVLGGASGWTGDSTGATAALLVPAFAGLVLLMVVLILPVPIPRAVQPRWFREEMRSGKGARRG